MGEGQLVVRKKRRARLLFFIYYMIVYIILLSLKLLKVFAYLLQNMPDVLA